MDANLIASIRTTLKTYPIDELRSLYEARDLSKWSVEAFEAMRQLLAERGVDNLPLPVPDQVSGPSPMRSKPGLFDLCQAGLYAGGALAPMVSLLSGYLFIDVFILFLVGGASLGAVAYYLSRGNPESRWRGILSGILCLFLMVALVGGGLGSAGVLIAKKFEKPRPTALQVTPVR